jgi:hypothetical protein
MALLIGASLIFPLQRHIDEVRSVSQKVEELRFVPSGPLLRAASMGYREFAADLLWLKAVQFVGGKDRTGKGYDWLYHVLDVVTDLDPKFYDSYWLGALSLSVLGDHPDQSIRLLHKGIVEITDRWELPFYLGFNYYYFLNDFKNAAVYMEKASVLPGSPPFLTTLTAKLYAEAQSPMTGLNFIKSVYMTTEDLQIREELERIGKALEVKMTLEALNKAAEAFRLEYPAETPSIDRLLTLGLISRNPNDPNRGNYYWDSKQKTFESTHKTEELKVHIDEVGRRKHDSD